MSSLLSEIIKAEIRLLNQVASDREKHLFEVNEQSVFMQMQIKELKENIRKSFENYSKELIEYQECLDEIIELTFELSEWKRLTNAES